MSNEFIPSTYEEDQEIAYDIAEATDALRTDAALRRLGTKTIDKMVSVGAKPYEVTTAINSMTSRENTTPDQQLSKAADIADKVAHDNIGYQGNYALKSPEKITAQMTHEATALDKQADDLEDRIAANYEDKKVS